jgi:hypothetical protein
MKKESEELFVKILQEAGSNMTAEEKVRISEIAQKRTGVNKNEWMSFLINDENIK